MTIRRLFVAQLPEGGGSIALGDAAARHVRVLRLRTGDRVLLFDGRGCTAEATLESVGDAVTCFADAPTVDQSLGTRVALLLAIPKGPKLDDCVRMATELGVDEVMLLETERTVPRWEPRRLQSRLDRLTRIACEAAAQCERNDVPIVHPPRRCSTWLREMPSQTFGVLFAARAEAPLTMDGTPEQVWCAVGPEGGFSEAEVSLFEQGGFAVASLGRWVLRVETAVPAALTLVRDRLDRQAQAR